MPVAVSEATRNWCALRPRPTPWTLFKIRSVPSSTVATRFLNAASLSASWSITEAVARARRACPAPTPSTWYLINLACTTCSEIYSLNNPLGDAKAGAAPLRLGLVGSGVLRAKIGRKTRWRYYPVTPTELTRAGHRTLDVTELAALPGCA